MSPDDALDVDVDAGEGALADLVVALRGLDRLLEHALTAAEATYGSEAAADPFRGLHIGRGEAERLLAREPGTPILAGAGQASIAAIREGSRLEWLVQAFDLTPFDTDAILVALAPELDLRYERLYAYLQDDVTRRLPTVDLVLNLLSASPRAKLEGQARFAPEAPLIRHGLVRLVADPQHVQPPLLGHYLKLDEQIVRLLLGQGELDSRLAPFAEVLTPPPPTPPDAEGDRLLAMVAQAHAGREPLRLCLHGPAAADRHRAATGLAGACGMPLLSFDLDRAATQDDLGALLKLVFREAWFRDAILYLDGTEALDGAMPARRLLADCLAADAGITLLGGNEPWVSPPARQPAGVANVAFPVPAFARRRECWAFGLDEVGVELEPAELDALADRFRLTPERIADAAVIGVRQARRCARGAGADDFFAAARALSGVELGRLAHKVEPRSRWRDIVLPADTLAQLSEICQRVVHRQRVLGDWGFDRRLSMGKGVNALFAGPSGTGKTMAAEIIADELKLDLYKVNLAGVVSKYIGETEKNLDRIFAAAENANAIVLFDEADALFGKRSEVRDSHDRYANIEISYLLQKMEEYEGVAILATNLRQNLDESFVRRLAFTVHFPFPDEADRRRIWAGIWPPETPLADDVDLDDLARRFKLAGGNIKNVALAAAFLAAEEGGEVSMAHVLHATRREYQKLGKNVDELARMAA